MGRKGFVTGSGLLVSDKPTGLRRALIAEGFDVGSGLTVKLPRDGHHGLWPHTVATAFVGGKEIVIDTSVKQIFPTSDSGLVIMEAGDWWDWIRQETGIQEPPIAREMMDSESLEGHLSWTTTFEPMSEERYRQSLYEERAAATPHYSQLSQLMDFLLGFSEREWTAAEAFYTDLQAKAQRAFDKIQQGGGGFWRAVCS